MPRSGTVVTSEAKPGYFFCLNISLAQFFTFPAPSRAAEWTMVLPALPAKGGRPRDLVYVHSFDVTLGIALPTFSLGQPAGLWTSHLITL